MSVSIWAWHCVIQTCLEECKLSFKGGGQMGNSAFCCFSLLPLTNWLNLQNRSFELVERFGVLIGSVVFWSGDTHRDLAPRDISGTSDPFARVIFNNHSAETAVSSMCVHVLCVCPPLYFQLVLWSLVKRDLVLGFPNSPTCWVLDYQEDPFPSLGRDSGAGAGSRGAQRGGNCHCGGLGLGYGGQEWLPGKGEDTMMIILFQIFIDFMFLSLQIMLYLYVQYSISHHKTP